MSQFKFYFSYTNKDKAGEEDVLLLSRNLIAGLDQFHRIMQQERKLQPSEYRISKVGEIYREGFTGNGPLVEAIRDLPNCPNPPATDNPCKPIHKILSNEMFPDAKGGQLAD